MNRESSSLSPPTRGMSVKLRMRVKVVCDEVMREWLSGRASPCQGESRGFDPRLPLQFSPWRWVVIASLCFPTHL
jgi:hypothetical protein